MCNKKETDRLGPTRLEGCGICRQPLEGAISQETRDPWYISDKVCSLYVYQQVIIDVSWS